MRGRRASSPGHSIGLLDQRDAEPGAARRGRGRDKVGCTSAAAGSVSEHHGAACRIDQIEIYACGPMWGLELEDGPNLPAA